MGVSILDGTIEEAVLKRSVRNLRVFHHVRFRLRDGETKTVAKPLVDASVAHLLQPGASGRFYLYTSIDQRGIHGVRDDQGHATFGFPKNNEIAMLVVFIFSLVWIGITVGTLAVAPLLATILLLFSGPYYLYLNKLRHDAKRQFDGDSHYSPTASAAPRLDPGPAVGA
jgi:hypothetical protein